MPENYGGDWSSLPWNDVIPRLLLFSHRLIRRVGLHSEMDAADFVWQAIEKTLSQSRRWNPAIPLLQHLMGVIASDVYNAKRKQIRAQSTALDEAVDVASTAPDPEQIAIGNAEADALLSFVQKKDNQAAELLLVLIQYGAERPQELADILKLPVEEIYALRKKLRRLTLEFRTKDTSTR